MTQFTLNTSSTSVHEGKWFRPLKSCNKVMKVEIYEKAGFVCHLFNSWTNGLWRLEKRTKTGKWRSCHCFLFERICRPVHDIRDYTNEMYEMWFSDGDLNLRVYSHRSDCWCKCLPLSGKKHACVSLVKLHVDRMFVRQASVVCVFQTHKARGFRNYPFSSCATSPPNPAPSETTQKCILQHTHALAFICQLFLHVCVQNTQSQA